MNFIQSLASVAVSELTDIVVIASIEIKMAAKSL